MFYNVLEAAEIIRTVTLALAHLHSMDIAHRDLKVSLMLNNYKYILLVWHAVACVAAGQIPASRATTFFPKLTGAVQAKQAIVSNTVTKTTVYDI